MTHRPKDKLHYYLAPQSLRIDPTFCPIKRRRNWETYERIQRIHSTWLNFPELPPPKKGESPTEKYMLSTLNGVITAFKGIPDLSCFMLVKIAKMIVSAIEVFNEMEQTGHPWTMFFEGIDGLCWDIQIAPPRNVLMGLYARIIFLPSHFLVTFEEAFYTGFFEIMSNIFSPMNKDPRSRFIAFMQAELESPLKNVMQTIEVKQRIEKFQRALQHISKRKKE